MGRWLSIAVLSLGLLAAPRAAAQPAQAVTIDARYAPRGHRVDGTVTFAFRNTSRVALSALVFHRYLEAFRDARSVFMRESGGQLRDVQVAGRGGTSLRSLHVDGRDVLARLERELVPGDFTQMRLPLDSPIPPGGGATIVVGFTSYLPPLAARAGYLRDFAIVAQWFPKLAKLEDDGRFASFPYHGNGEFYADFARYDVTLRIPHGYAIEGTGLRVARAREGDWERHRFVASPVHDAAYVIAPDLETLARRCHAVDVRVAYPTGYGSVAREHLDATCFGLGYFGRRLGAYPYPTLSVIVPPRGAEGGAGMEYPTAFLTGGPWYPTRALPYADAIDTTMHELGHQWFQGLVATNEDEHPVLDEGLTSFLGYDATAVYTGNPDAARYEWWRPYATYPHLVPPERPASAFTSAQYGASVYGHSALVLETLARTYGRERLYEALGGYARAQRFRHPAPEALLQAFDATFGPGFGARVVAPLLYAGKSVEARVARERGRLVARRSGPLDLPLTIELRDAHGTRRLRWSGQERYVAPRGTRCLVVDPDERSLLDRSRADDLVCAPPDDGPLATRLGDLFALFLRAVGP